MGQIAFDNSYARLPERLYARVSPAQVRAPKLLAFNQELADRLGLDVTGMDLAAAFSGNALPEGAEPLAQLYAGHQFGGLSPQLGDGRAHLIGEVVAPDGKRFDIQLKGSGRTPFSRQGDGKAWIGPVLREYVLSEAMAICGVPTTRALAAVATGERVQRERAMPGAILTRVASSHLRVGHFEALAVRGDEEGMAALFDYARKRHHAEVETPLEFLQAVIAVQAKLVARWMGLGFIHGVMNTDNTTISGETIDYGPCAFMEAYNPRQVFSYIDQYGRYAYCNQTKIIAWNMAQLASALLLLEKDQDAMLRPYTDAVHAMPEMVERETRAVFAAKLGIADPQAGDQPLIDSFLTLIKGLDFTNTFRGFAEGTEVAGLTDGMKYAAWRQQWQARVGDVNAARKQMLQANPALIPRNHQVEALIQTALDGDTTPFEKMMAALPHAFAPRAEDDWLRKPADAYEAVKQTFCGT